MSKYDGNSAIKLYLNFYPFWHERLSTIYYCTWELLYLGTIQFYHAFVFCFPQEIIFHFSSSPNSITNKQVLTLQQILSVSRVCSYLIHSIMYCHYFNRLPYKFLVNNMFFFYLYVGCPYIWQEYCCHAIEVSILPLSPKYCSKVLKKLIKRDTFSR